MCVFAKKVKDCERKEKTESIYSGCWSGGGEGRDAFCPQDQELNSRAIMQNNNPTPNPNRSNWSWGRLIINAHYLVRVPQHGATNNS
eukprot:gene11088-7716_t